MSDEVFEIPSEVPLFPLPGIVLFPHTLMPLHIFEPRYRAMTADALAGPHIIAMALLRPGWEELYYTPRARVHPTIGLGRIVQSEQLADGNYNILLRGLGRANIVKEVATQPYRMAQIELMETFCSAAPPRETKLRKRIFAAIRDNPGIDPGLRTHWLRLRKLDLGLDQLSDLLAAGMPAEAELRQCLLAEPDGLTRAEIILGQIRTLAEVARNHLQVGPPKPHNLN